MGDLLFTIALVIGALVLFVMFVEVGLMLLGLIFWVITLPFLLVKSLFNRKESRL